MNIERIHHVAYRCVDAKETVEWYGKYLGMDFILAIAEKETVEWYGKYLGMDFILAIAENEVPSTKAADPYMHVFLDAGNGNVLAFFELPTKPAMGRDPNTPAWVQHIAFKLGSMQELLECKARLEADAIDVVGVTDHTIFKSIYFFDPNGHRLELTVDTATAKMNRMLDDVKWDMLEEWARTRRAPQHARWMHDGTHAD